MKKITIALLIGITAGIIDVIPMLVMELNWYANASAFLHWIVLGLIIPFVSWDVYAWIKGSTIGVLSAVPVIVITLEQDASSVVPILVSSLVIGAFVGIAGNKFINV